MAMTGAGTPAAPRRTAVVVWAAMVAGLVLLLGVAAALGPAMQAQADPELGETLVAVLGLVSAGSLIASRVVPRWVKVPAALADQAALPKQLIACAFCDAGALFAVVVWMLTGSPLALALLLLPLAGLLSCWPGEARWAALGGAAASPPRGFGPPGPGARPR
jgi:hypothetical protein